MVSPESILQNRVSSRRVESSAEAIDSPLTLANLSVPRGLALMHRSEPTRGIWCFPEHDSASIRRAMLRPEFQAACFSRAGGCDEVRFGQALQPLIDAQIPLREVRFEKVIGRDGFSGRRDIDKLSRCLGFEKDDAAALGAIVGAFSAQFAAVSAARAWRVQLSSERGPRRMELEDGSCPSSFHVDDSHLRLVAAIVGPPTVCAIDLEAARLERRRRGVGGAAGSAGGQPFCFDTAVRRNFESFFAPVIEDPSATLSVPPRGSAVVFGGSRRAAGRPLVHAGPQPGNAAEALAWRRLLLVIDEIDP